MARVRLIREVVVSLDPILATSHTYPGPNLARSGEEWVDLRERGVRDVVKRTPKQAEETGDADFRYVSSHDLRRRFAQRLIVDRQMNPRVVIHMGGWESFQAIEAYLNAPTPEVVNKTFEEIDLP